MNNKRYVAYFRVSTDTQSIDRQVETVNKWIHDYKDNVGDGAILVSSFDEKESGFHNERPELNKMLDFVKDPMNKIDGVILHEISRLARKTGKAITICEDLMDLKINVHLLDKNLNTLNADGSIDNNTQMMLSLLASFASMEAKQMSYRMLNGKMKKVKEGKSMNIYEPYGYEKNKETGKLDINDEEAEIVKYVYAEYLKKTSVPTIIKNLNDDNVPTRFNKNLSKTRTQNPKNKNRNKKWFGDKDPSEFKWSAGVIYKMLNNSTYMGKRKYLDFFIDVPVIIKPSIFQQVQERKADKTNKGRDVVHNYILPSKKTICYCGHTYFPNKKANKKSNSYNCLSKRSLNKEVKDSCENWGMGINKFSNALWFFVRRSGNLKKKIKEEIEKSDITSTIKKNEAQFDLIQNDIDDITKQIDHIQDLIIDGLIPKEKFIERKDSFDKATAKAVRKQKKIKDEITRLKNVVEHRLDINTMLKTVKANQNNVTEYTDAVVEEVVIYPYKDERFKISNQGNNQTIYCEIHYYGVTVPECFICGNRTEKLVVIPVGLYDKKTFKIKTLKGIEELKNERYHKKIMFDTGF